MWRLVIASKDYGDFLKVTLPAWCALVEEPAREIRVVTSAEDWESQQAIMRCGVQGLRSDEWDREGAVLNLAAAFDDGFQGTEDGTPCLALDADVYPVGSLPNPDTIERNTIYGARRYQCDDGFSRGALEPPANLGHIAANGRGDSPEACAGYFQMFRFDGARRFGSYPTAATYDYHFAFSFARARTLDCIEVLHLDERRRNWSGRVTPRWGAA